MKKNLFILSLLFAVISSLIVYAYAADTINVSKVYLKYQDGTEKTYDITTATITADEGGSYSSGPYNVCTLTDTDNSLPSGVITEIKLYGQIVGGPGSGWLNATLGQKVLVADGFNFLDANVDLSSIKRKKVTTRVRGDGSLHALIPSEENL